MDVIIVGVEFGTELGIGGGDDQVLVGSIPAGSIMLYGVYLSRCCCQMNRQMNRRVEPLDRTSVVFFFAL